MFVILVLYGRRESRNIMTLKEAKIIKDSYATYKIIKGDG